ncbi:rhomboid family intramembrane serine protease [Flavobacterium taihuense]|uniref:Rhomboid family intramembrane serine protease n=1 Tax=Flavobacterium taihuense TaxID=2857508 RepID=A0ABS6Y297_9FLAO|nr:rhomboid family intramembrane serine protease [Flavobacterium taihuense]MBW4362223.1 rhomboid family intramembrane serine protease [Flavobacterium taihuense]
MMNITPTVKQLLIINILFFIGSMIVGEPAYKLLSMYFFESPDFHFWQLFTHMFMHAPLPNIMHIAFNMFALYSFGSALEHFWGGKKFLFFYISCGLGAALLHTGVNYYFFENGINTLVANGYQKVEILKILSEGKFDTKWQELLAPSDFQAFMGAYLGNVVGASGAIYGLLVAFAFMFPNAELALMFIPIPIKAKYFVPALLLIDLYLGVSGGSLFGGSSGIAHFAHLGGALVGFVMMWYWKKNQFDNHRWN